MTKQSPERMKDFLQRQDHQTLVNVLLELAAEHEAVLERLDRMLLSHRPEKLAASFKKTLSAWRRSTTFHSYRESGAYGRQLEAWLEQVERELVPQDPPAAVALFESFIESDAVWFEHADDSDGHIGDAMRAACRHWLKAAARCEPPADVWSERLVKLFEADEYGARGELLKRADLLLSASALRDLVASFETRLAEAVVQAPQTKAEGFLFAVFGLSSALSLLAEALNDPDISVRATLSHSPEPNSLQREQFARDYLKANRPSEALLWLQESWGTMEHSRQNLLAEAMGRLGRFEESSPIRQQMFERTLRVFDLQRWLEHLPEAARPEALSSACQRALDHGDPAVAAVLLLELGEAQAAEAKLVADPVGVCGAHYAELLPLAKSLRAHACWRGEAVVYRALMSSILERGYAKAYGHAARYWNRLIELNASGVDLLPLPAHGDFEADVRSRHGRKASFWRQVESQRDSNSTYAA